MKCPFDEIKEGELSAFLYWYLQKFKGKPLAGQIARYIKREDIETYREITPHLVAQTMRISPMFGSTKIETKRAARYFVNEEFL